ncbi:SigB/SigF/SigG family RNA polymerase sigma factor [Dactylosporangium fulvum]|uniref:SigB/SigF/SigG family RNA polymerase sigma factor n=1 Tax=Dactylosporangium fulvum TaxID=53359 RepID=A0ABY5W8X7_9ACTN|nr:SigB/SigF/SigG family RNA polymerase sigma factor [Dactylosporangium fulvum]UWP85469.1 SigB/SigF/SigG family RNA polymerase sigma factor [Dactylosporangium fulvum]
MTVLATPTSILTPQPATEPTPRPIADRPARRATAVGTTAHRADSLRAGPPGATEHLLRARGRLPAGHPDRDVLRARAIEDNLPLAGRLARRYTGRGERHDDLRQVAALALVLAVDGYDPNRTTLFVSYAVPTIVGALKRHFRDTTWAMRVPRAAQELLLEIPAATSHLTQLRGRPPTSVELADHLSVNMDVLQAAVSAGQVYRLPSLNESASDHDGTELIDLIGAVDPHYGKVDDHLALGPLLAALPLRERRILTMRFSDEMTQSRIAAELGLSQMHVSRLLKRSLNQLRTALLDPDVARTADARGLTPNR